MEKLNAVVNWYKGLKKRTKVVVGFAALVLLFALVECLSGCSSYELGKTWSF